MQEVNTIKHYCFIGRILVQRLLEINRMLRPVHGLLFVVANMVTIVPAFYIVLGIDTGNAVLVVIPRVSRIDKRMLRPVAHHSYEAVYKERDDEHPKRS